MEGACQSMTISRKIFISRSSDGPDGDAVLEALATLLESEGHSVFFDGRKEVPLSWPDETNRQIFGADHILVIFSRGYFEKWRSAPERGLAKGSGSKGEGVVWEWNLIQNRISKASRSDFVTPCFLADSDKSFSIPPLDGAAERIVIPAVPESTSGPIKRLLERIQQQVAPKRDNEPLPTDSEIEQDHGIILVGDMVDFSAETRKTAEQRVALHRMWTYLRSHPDLRKHRALMDSTLDGATVIIKGVRHREALQFAADWIRHVEEEIPRGNGPQFGFRVGVHVGYFDTLSRTGEMLDQDKLPNAEVRKAGAESENAVNLPQDDRMVMIFGIGPNDADRLTRMGDSGHIIVSEAFVRSFANTGNTLAETFPPAHQPPFQAFPKPTQPQEFRVYTGHQTSDPELPQSLCQMQRADTRLKEILSEIAETFWMFLEDTGDKATPPKNLDWKALRKRSKLRVSLFARNPERPGRELVCTEYRHLDFAGKAPDQERLRSGNTRYSLESPEEGQGPAGRAFKSNRVVVVHDLPKEKKGLRCFVWKTG
jgi:hypothetical protein